MKKLLLIGGLLGLSYSASAQAALVQLLVNATMLGVRAAKKSPAAEPQIEKADPNVQQVEYRAQHLGLKRTPPAELQGKGSAEIAKLEAVLQECYAAMTTDSLAAVLPETRLAAFRAARVEVSKLRPKWDVNGYRDEFNFYLGEDARRQRVARALAAPAAK